VSARTVTLDVAGQHKLARDLMAGGVFVPNAAMELNEECELVLLGNGDDEVRVQAIVVFANASGIGLQLHNCDADLKQQIAELAAGVGVEIAPAAPPPQGARVSSAAPAAPVAPVDARSPSAPLAAPVDARSPSAPLPAPVDARSPSAPLPAPEDAAAAPPLTLDLEPDAAVARDAAASADEPDDGADGETEESRKTGSGLHDRLRGLTMAMQIKMAHTGEASERIVLERLYGKNVWEGLLRNPRLTGPEVARIARMGSLPRPLMEIIVGNGGWLQIPEVRRALLSNPRLATDHIMRILRMLPKHELKLAAQQTAYPLAVRDVAKKLLKEQV
jgi:hypothetical protein